METPPILNGNKTLASNPSVAGRHFSNQHGKALAVMPLGGIAP
jgi:hypothetical protein